MTRIINIAGTSGAGKTILALNLGIALAGRGREVILVDANIYSPDIAYYSDSSPQAYLNEFLEGEKEIEDIIHLHPSGLKVISSMPEEIHDQEKHKRINDALIKLIGKAEFVIVDSFSSHPAMFSVMNNADETIFITNDDFPSIAKSKDIIQRMEQKGMNVVGVVLNRKQKRTTPKHIEAVLDKPIMAALPYSQKVIDSINLRQPVYLTHPKSDISKVIADLSALLDVFK